jgi:hypothetical protein
MAHVFTSERPSIARLMEAAPLLRLVATPNSAADATCACTPQSRRTISTALFEVRGSRC